MDFVTLNTLYRCGKEFNHKSYREKGITDTECMICSFISSNKGCFQDNIVKNLKMDKTTVNKAIVSLEKKGYVERKQDKSDKRKRTLRITKSGEENISSIMNLHDKWFADVITCLNEQEQKQFDEYCKRLIVAAKDKISKGNK